MKETVCQLIYGDFKNPLKGFEVERAKGVKAKLMSPVAVNGPFLSRNSFCLDPRRAMVRVGKKKKGDEEC